MITDRPTAPQLVGRYVTAYRENHRGITPTRGFLAQLGAEFKRLCQDASLSNQDLLDLARIAGRDASTNLSLAWGREVERRTRDLRTMRIIDRPARGRDGYDLTL